MNRPGKGERVLPWRSKVDQCLAWFWRSLLTRCPKTWNCERDGHVWQTTGTEELSLELVGLKDDATMYEHTELIQETCVHCNSSRERERVEVREH